MRICNLLLVATLFTGCTTIEPTDSTELPAPATPEELREESTQLVTGPRLAIYWGLFQDQAKNINYGANALLITAGVETVFVTRGNPVTSPGGPAYNYLKSLGAKFAYHLPEETLKCWMDRGRPLPETQPPCRTGTSPEAEIATLLQTWDYVMVDEIHNGNSPGGDWTDFGREGARLRTLLANLDRYAHLKRRVMLAMHAGTSAPQNPSPSGDVPMSRYVNLMNQCQDQCRIMAFQIYMDSSELFAGAYTRLETLADRIKRLSPGSNNVSIPVLSLINNPADRIYLTQPNVDLYPWRGTGNGSGWGTLMLEMYFAKYGTLSRAWPGVAFYSAANVIDRPGYYSYADVAAVVGYLVDVWYGS